MNNVNLIGRLGSDPEVKFTPSGKAVAEINLAVDDGWGENKKTAWIGVVLWGATAELAGRALRKGDRVGITGRLSQDEWEDKATGKKQRKTKVTAESMHLIGAKREDAATPAPAPKTTPPKQGEDFDTEDDIPW